MDSKSTKLILNVVLIIQFWINFISISFNFDPCFDMIYSIWLNQIYSNWILEKLDLLHKFAPKKKKELETLQ
jgi:hypothetical protein